MTVAGAGLLGPADSLPCTPRRILLAGASGAGKTTLGQALSALTGIRYVGLDALYHGPNWTQRPEFEADVKAIAGTDAWITEFGYGRARPHVGPRAELLVWLDLPRWRVMTQVVPRTVRRRLRREELWNGNVEQAFHTIFTDPEHIVRWAWTTHGKTAVRVGQMRVQRPELPVVRLRSRRDVTTWLAGPARTLGPA
ncbi:adenylate kinase [Pseudonocardia ailaonensis]|uniref:Adenylate kinase n=1 Tax=Pseudonocardia ailaonensis TaxID=367279 RepID=A0ABN2MRS9_9PSEU